MKKSAIIITVLLSLLLVSCAGGEKSDLTSINDYIAPSYTEKIATGTLTFAENVGDTAIITDYVGLYTDHEVTVPEKIADREVTVIGKEAFYFCTSATKINLPATVTKIEDFAFAGCTSLETITIPATVTSIGKGAFNACTSLKTVIFEGEAVVSIGDFAFNDCSSLETINIPEGVKSIGNGAFKNCKALQSFKAPETLETIGGLSFDGCEALNTDGALTLTASITSIGDFAFVGINKEYIIAPEGSYAAEYVEAMKATEETEAE